jgi:putative PIN family toxin of toxin-antitoxin system
MLKVILDTNIIISFLVTDSDFIKKLIDLKNLRKLELFSSLEIFEELTNTLQKTKMKDLLKVNQKKVATFVAYYKYKIKFVKPALQIDICRDPKDNKFLELAKEIEANYLITGDYDLLDLKLFESTKILKPSDFINESKLIITKY